MGSSRKERIQLDPKTAAVFQKKGYDVMERIGEGAFGKVYKARSTKDGIMTAVKVMDTTKMSQTFRDQFLPRELEMLVILPSLKFMTYSEQRERFTSSWNLHPMEV